MTDPTQEVVAKIVAYLRAKGHSVGRLYADQIEAGAWKDTNDEG